MATSSYNANNGDLSEEPGEVENRLSLNPDDFPVTKKWKDGQSYPITIGGEDYDARQISMGEFEVMPNSEEMAANEEPTAEEEPEAPASGMPRRGTGYSNPAVENLIREKA